MEKDQEKRRSFLKHFLAGAAVAAGSVAAIKPAKAKTIELKQHGKDVLYHESESFKKYYKSL